MKKIILILACIFLVAGCGDIELENGENAAVTFSDDDGISSEEIYEELKDRYASEIITNIIDEYLLDKEYESTTDEKKYVKDVVSSVKEYAADAEMEYIDYISQYYRISDEEDFEDYIALNYKRNLWATDWTKTQVSDKQIKEYYEEYTIGDIKASHILISTEATEDMTDDEKDNLEKTALERAKEVIVKLNNGESFKDLAKEYSDDDASASDGGALGTFNRGEMASTFEDAVVALKVGEYTKTPVKTEYGYHIIYKTAQEDKPELKDVKDEIIETIAKEMLSSDSNLYYEALTALREKYEMSIKDSTLKNAFESVN